MKTIWRKEERKIRNQTENETPPVFTEAEVCHTNLVMHFSEEKKNRNATEDEDYIKMFE